MSAAGVIGEFIVRTVEFCFRRGVSGSFRASEGYKLLPWTVNHAESWVNKPPPPPPRLDFFPLLHFCLMIPSPLLSSIFRRTTVVPPRGTYPDPPEIHGLSDQLVVLGYFFLRGKLHKSFTDLPTQPGITSLAQNSILDWATTDMCTDINV